MIDLLRKIALFFLMFILVIDIPIIVMSSFTNGVILNEDFYMDEFEKIGLYSSLEIQIEEMMVGEEYAEEGDKIREAITEQWIRTQVDVNIINLIGYLRGEQDTFAPIISTKEIKEALFEGADLSDLEEEDEVFPDEYSPEMELGMLEDVRLLTSNILLIRNTSIGIAVLVVVLSFFVYKEKPKFFKKVGRRIAVSGGL